MKKMNLPNRLSLLRVALIVPFVLCARFGENSFWQVLAGLIFLIASVTDFLDGYIARKRHLITNFGKFVDPIADKLLVMSALIIFVEQGRLPAWMAILLIGREFIVSGFRLIAVEQRLVLAAGPLGKVKTALQMVSILIVLLFIPPTNAYDAYATFARVLFGLCTVISVWSGADYIIRNFKVIQDM